MTTTTATTTTPTTPTTVVTVTVQCGGRPIPPEYALLAMECAKEFNRIPRATLVFADGDPATRTFPISDGELFALGAKVEILVRHEGSPDAKLFDGLVVRQTITAGGGSSRLTVELRDAAVRLTRGPRSQVWTDVTDSEVLKRLATDAGLSVGSVPPTKTRHQRLVQYRCTDWDFLLERAEAVGLLVLVDDATMTLVKTGVAGGAAHAVDYGLSDVYDFELEADAQDQYQQVQTVGWDVAQKRPITATGSTAAKAPGNLSPARIASALNPPTLQLDDAVPSTSSELQSWADASLARSRAALVRGVVSTAGFGGVRPGDTLDLRGFGRRFSGPAQVTGVTHRVDEQGWRVDLRIGSDPDRFSDTVGAAEPPAAGLLPAVHGLQIGIVTSLDADPDKAYRVQVELPVLGADAPALWARLATGDAGDARGFVFRPEVGDEVAVGFFNDDPRQPVVLGGMFGPKNTPPKDYAQPDKANDGRAIVSRAGTVLGFLDTKLPSVFLRTPAGNSVELSDEDKAVRLKDQNGSSVELAPSGVTVKTAKDFTVSASGAVKISGRTVDLG